MNRLAWSEGEQGWKEIQNFKHTVGHRNVATIHQFADDDERGREKEEPGKPVGTILSSTCEYFVIACKETEGRGWGGVGEWSLHHSHMRKEHKCFGRRLSREGTTTGLLVKYLYFVVLFPFM